MLTSLVLGSAVLVSNDGVYAQVVPDHTLGNENSRVTFINERNQRIDGGAIRGSSLFHSFQDFGVPEGSGVYFSNPEPIENIFSRVTGNAPSNIYGTLGVLGDANLFLLNPNGILFGPNARLDVEGSFVASTANRLVLPNGSQFSATNPEAPSLLEVNVQAPVGLQFEGEQPGLIVNSGNLEVGQNLTLVGGVVVSTGNLSTPAGDIAVVATPGVSSTGSPVVHLNQGGQFVGQTLASQSVEHTPASRTDLSLPEVVTEWSGETGLRVNDEGQVELAGSQTQVPINAGTAVVAGTLDASHLSPEQAGGTVQVSGSRVALIDNARIDVTGSAGGGTALIGGNYQGQGNLPNADHTFVGNEVAISADAITEGNGGQVVVWADETTQFYGNATARGGNQSGDGGLIEISGAENLAFNGIADVGAVAGAPGTVLFDPRDIHIVAGVGSDSNQVADGSVFSNDGGTSTDFQISATALAGISGNITLQATRDININTPLTLPGTAGTTVSFSANGNIDGSGQRIIARGRDIQISGRNVTLGIVETNNLSNDAGNIHLTATRGEVNVNQLIASSGSNSGDSGNGGNITIESQGNINAHAISSFSQVGREALLVTNGRAGHGGNVRLTSQTGNITTNGQDISTWSRVYGDGQTENAGSIMLDSPQGSISTQAVLAFSVVTGQQSRNTDNGANPETNGGITNLAGNGGSIALNAAHDITSTFLNSSSNVGQNPEFANGESQSSSGMAGRGGNIIITTNSVTDDNPGDITIGGLVTSSLVNGNGVANRGGNVTIRSANGSIIMTPVDGDGGSLSTFSQIVGNCTENCSNAISGNITLFARSNITTNNIRTFSRIFGSGTAGGGGAIHITSQSGDFSPQAGSRLISSRAFSGGNGGDINIRAENISLDNTDVTTASSGEGNAGNIYINAANRISLNQSRIFSSLEPGASGDGGDVEIYADEVSLNNFSFIDTATFGTGNAGNVHIDTEDSISLGNQSAIFSITAGLCDSGSQCNGGNVALDSDGSITLADRSSISTAVNNSLLELPESSSANSSGVSNGGNVSITADSLSLRTGSQVQGLTRGNGNAGHVEINVENSVTITGNSNGLRSGVFTSSKEDSRGSGGDIELTTGGILEIRDGAALNAQTASHFPGGNIIVSAQRLELIAGGQILTSTTNMGDAGSIDIDATESIFISGEGPVLPNVESFNQNVRQEPSIDRFFEEEHRSGILNNSIASAEVLDDMFIVNPVNDANAFVEFSTRIPHISIVGGISDPADADFYQFRVTPGTRAIFDIDSIDLEGNPISNVDTRITLFDNTGQQLPNPERARSTSNDEPFFLGGDGSRPRSFDDNLSPDPYLSYIFTDNNTFYIQVRGQGGSSGSYTLNVSLEAPNVSGVNILPRISPEISSALGIDPSRSSGLFTQSQSTGEAGNIEVDTQQLTVEGRAAIAAFTTIGEAGSISISNHGSPSNSVIVRDGGRISAQATDPRGVAGDVTINTRHLQVQNGAEISSENISAQRGGSVELNELDLLEVDNGLISASTRRGQAGSLTVDANTIELSGSQLFNGNTQSGLAVQSISGTGGNLTVNTQRLTVRDEAAIAASTRTGNAGSVSVNQNQSPAQSVVVSNRGSISARATGDRGRAGSVTVNAHELTLEEDSEISTSNVSGVSEGITLRGLDRLQVHNSEISASTQTGRAGSVNVNEDQRSAQQDQHSAQQDQSSAQSVVVSNRGSISARAEGDRGRAGNVTINTRNLQVENGAEISVSSPEGIAGNLEVTAGEIRLDDGELSAVTGSGDGGNITLHDVDLLWMQNDSEISAQALRNADGGNVRIYADDGFIIAYPYGNGDPQGGNDIRADADRGRGGEVRIDAQGIIGLEERDGDTPLSDINVSSQFNSDGVFINNTPGVDPNRGLTPLPDEPDSPELSNACQVGGGSATAEFFDIGRGGTPPRPDEPLNANTVSQDWIDLESIEQGDSSDSAETESVSLPAQARASTSLPTAPCQTP